MRRTSSRWYWLAVLLTAVLVTLYVDRRDLQGRYEGYLQTQQAVKARAAEAAELEAQVDTVRQRVEDLESDPIALEAVTRRLTRKVREGETVFQIVLPGENLLAQPEETAAGEHEAHEIN